MNCFPVDSATNPTLAQSQSLASPPGTPAAASPAGYPATAEDGVLDELHGSTFPVFGFVRVSVSSTAAIQTVRARAILDKAQGDGPNLIALHAVQGQLQSDPLVLVTDADDDFKFNGSGTDDGPDDATLQASFGSPLKIEFPDFNHPAISSQAAEPVGSVRVSVAYCSLSNGPIPQDKLALIELQVRKAKEVYRQIGIDLQIASDVWPLQLIDGNGFDFSSLSTRHLNASVSEHVYRYLRNQKQHPIRDKTIVVGFVDAILTEPDSPYRTLNGFSITSQPFILVSIVNHLDPPRVESFRDHFTLAHEIGHTVTKSLNHAAPSSWHRLMNEPIIYRQDHKDSKRWDKAEEDLIKNLKYFYVPNN